MTHTLCQSPSGLNLSYGSCLQFHLTHLLALSFILYPYHKAIHLLVLLQFVTPIQPCLAPYVSLLPRNQLSGTHPFSPSAQLPTSMHEGMHSLSTLPFPCITSAETSPSLARSLLLPVHSWHYRCSHLTTPAGSIIQFQSILQYHLRHIICWHIV